MILWLAYAPYCLGQSFEQSSAAILKHFITIEKQQASLVKTQRQLNGFYAETAKLSMYYQATMLKKVSIEYDELENHWTDSYYFSNNKLFMCRSVKHPCQQSEKKQGACKQYYLYQQGQILKPAQTGAVQKSYLLEAASKRNRLIEALARAASQGAAS